MWQRVTTAAKVVSVALLLLVALTVLARLEASVSLPAQELRLPLPLVVLLVLER